MTVKDLTSEEWFRQQGDKHRVEIKELRAVINNFIEDLDGGGLTGRLLASELRARVRKVRAT